MLALLAVVAIAQSRGQISFTTRGETVGALLREVSKLTGIALNATPQTAREIVIVSVNGVQLDVFRDRLAQAVGARWKKENDGWRLVRPLDLERAQALAERKLRVREVLLGVQNLKKRVAAKPTFDDKYAQTLANQVNAVVTKYKGHISDSPGLEASMALEPGSPGGRLAIAAVAALTPEQLADVEPGGRIVYSTEPTRVQRQLPNSVLPAIQRYLVEQQIYVDALKRVMTSNDWSSSYSPLLSTASAEAPAMVLVSTERSPYNPSLGVHVKFVRKDGKFAGEPHTLLDFPSVETKDPDLGEGTIPVSPASARLLAGLKALQSGKTFLEDQTLIQELSQMEQHDPLSYTVADGLLGLSKENNLVACVPDEGFFQTLFETVIPDDKIDLKKFSKWMTRECDVRLSDGWLVASPRRMITTRSQRVDRALVGGFLRNSQQNEGATLEDMAEFVSKLPRNYMETIVPFYAFFVLPDLNAGISDRNVELLRIYGRLSPSQRLEMTTQRAITVDSLAQDSYADLNYLVYRADSPISISVRTRGSAPPPAQYVATIDSEVTVALPNGVPAKATLSLYGQSSEAVMGDGGSSVYSTYHPMSAWSLGSMMARAEIADPSDKREKVAIERFRFGHTRSLQFELELTESISVRADFHESKFSRKGASVPFDQLPASFRAAVEAAKIQVRKQLEGTKAKQQVPPP